MSKIKARNITSQVPGPTFDHNDPAKFPNKGKEHGKTMSNKTVVSQATGPTFTCNDPAVKQEHASEYGKGKELSSKAAPQFTPKGRKPVNVANEPVVTTPAYPLKKSYEK